MKRLVLCLAFLFLVMVGSPLAQDLANFVPPKLLKSQDTPNDDGSSISLTWLESESEANLDVDYVLYMSPTKDGPWTHVAKRTSAKLGYKSDDPSIYDYKDENEYFHFVRVRRRNAYVPEDEQELQAGLAKLSKTIEIIEKTKNARERINDLDKKKEVIAWQKTVPQESDASVRARFDKASRLVQLIEEAKSTLPKLSKLSKNRRVIAWEKEYPGKTVEDARKEYTRIARLVRLLDKARQNVSKLSSLSKSRRVRHWKERAPSESKVGAIARFLKTEKLIDVIEAAKRHAKRLSKFSKDKSGKGKALTHLLETKLAKLEKDYLRLATEESAAGLPRDVAEMKREVKKRKQERKELQPVVEMFKVEGQIIAAENDYLTLQTKRLALPRKVAELKREQREKSRELKKLKLVVDKLDLEAKLGEIQKAYLGLLPERPALPRGIVKLRGEYLEFRRQRKQLDPIIEKLTLEESLSSLEQQYATLEPGKALPIEISQLENEYYTNQEKMWAAEDELDRARKRYDRATYYFRLGVAPSDGAGAPRLFNDIIASASAKGNLFSKSKTNNFSIMIVYSIIVLAFIRLARRNPDLFLRKISGLDAVEDALGRATEMGRPVMFIHGLNPMDSISTVASVNILGRIARRIAEYDARLKVVNVDPIVMSVSQEVVKESYTEAGRPDAYNDDDVFLVASAQFPYALAVSGIMMRDRPAANFFMGYFYAESLILAETGAMTGAIQIAGTDSYTQIPFFITTCDYTLIGEELYAASAYLSREPLLLGSLRGQDVGKAFILLLLVVGTLLATIGIKYLTYLFQAY